MPASYEITVSESAVDTPPLGAAAEASKAAMDASGRFPGPIVTPILPADTFYDAEEYHQDFYKKSPDEYHEDRAKSGRDEFIANVWGDDYYDLSR